MKVVIRFPHVVIGNKLVEVPDGTDIDDYVEFIMEHIKDDDKYHVPFGREAIENALDMGFASVKVLER